MVNHDHTNYHYPATRRFSLPQGGASTPPANIVLVAWPNHSILWRGSSLRLSANIPPGKRIPGNLPAQLWSSGIA